jgi:hypothetical protein
MDKDIVGDDPHSSRGRDDPAQQRVAQARFQGEENQQSHPYEQGHDPDQQQLLVQIAGL